MGNIKKTVLPVYQHALLAKNMIIHHFIDSGSSAILAGQNLPVALEARVTAWSRLRTLSLE